MRKFSLFVLAASIFLASCGGGGGEGPHSVQLIAIPAGYTAGDMNDNGTVSLTKPGGVVDGLATYSSSGKITAMPLHRPGSFNFVDSVINNNGRVFGMTHGYGDIVVEEAADLQLWSSYTPYGPRNVYGYNNNLEYVPRSPDEVGVQHRHGVIVINGQAVLYDANDFGGGVYLRLLDLNETRQILGMRSPDIQPQNRIFFISTNGSVVDLQKGAATIIHAESLNDSAQVAGSAMVGGIIYPALWGRDGQVNVLTAFPNVEFTKLNNNGQALGKRSPVSGPSVWTDSTAEDVLYSNGSLKSVQSLAPNTALGKVLTLNDQGRILTSNYVIIP